MKLHEILDDARESMAYALGMAAVSVAATAATLALIIAL